MIVDYKETLRFVIDYIEMHIKEDINLDHLAHITYLSKFHLHRVFKSITSESLIKYVRGRKLSYSAYDLLNTDLSILKIALDYNYNQEQSFNRAFKQEFQISPAKYRKEKCELFITHKLDINNFYSFDNGLLISPVFFLKPEFSIVGLQHQISFEDDRRNGAVSKASVDFCNNYLHIIPNVKDTKVFIGFDKYNKKRDYLDYTTATEVTTIDNIPKDMVGYVIPTTQFVCFKYIGFHPPEEINARKLISLFNFIFTQWFPNSIFKQSKPFHFQRLDLKKCTDSYCEMEMFFPIH
ncbi:AraC family transcriptional regulator [Natranaerovirga pectinivora]|uniref:AraC family transcriptional regulator n=2 Tax=Natranaerovirga pectinivora TaxID=682400 RepID=A0A4R3MS63_9FIRM|nr:AraC family transcriptional regulator [Natranaerovirga pectinivora]